MTARNAAARHGGTMRDPFLDVANVEPGQSEIAGHKPSLEPADPIRCPGRYVVGIIIYSRRPFRPTALLSQ